MHTVSHVRDKHIKSFLFRRTKIKIKKLTTKKMGQTGKRFPKVYFLCTKPTKSFY